MKMANVWIGDETQVTDDGDFVEIHTSFNCVRLHREEAEKLAAALARWLETGTVAETKGGEA